MHSTDSNDFHYSYSLSQEARVLIRGLFKNDNIGHAAQLPVTTGSFEGLEFQFLDVLYIFMFEESTQDAF